MDQNLLLIAMLVLAVGVMWYSGRSRKQQMAKMEEEKREQLRTVTPGAWVHTRVGFWGRFVDLDGDIVVLETTEQPQPGLAEITADSEAALTQEQVGAVAEAVGSLDTQTRQQVASGSATTTGQVTLVLSSGARVVWGGSADSALKAEVLAVLLGQPASTYDVSSPHSPTTSGGG